MKYLEQSLAMNVNYIYSCHSRKEMVISMDVSTKKYKRRQWVKNFAIIFLAVMLILTFFSNTIMNYSLAEVDTKAATAGQLTERIRESGTVKALDSYDVTLSQSREVESVNVKQGDKVEAGDTLFTLTDKESEELKTARQELEDLRFEYESALLGVKVPSYAVDNAEIQSLQAALKQAQQERSALGSTTITLAEAKAKVASAESAVGTWSAKEDDIQSKITQVDSDDPSYSPIRAEVLALEDANNALVTAKAQYDLYVDEDDIFTGSAELANNLKNANTKVSECTIALNNKKMSEKKALLEQLDAARSSLSTAKTELTNAESNFNNVEAIKNAEDALTQAKDALNTKVLALAAQQGEDKMSDAQSDLSLEAQEKKIAQKVEEIAKLEEDSVGAEVTAKYGGVISSLNVTSGTTFAEDEVLAIIDVTDKGYTSEISISITEAEKLKVGGSADVQSSSNWYSNLTATITSIKNDPDKPGKNRLITFEITGEPTVGESLTFSIPLSTKNYEAIVPQSAVHEDENGKFVFVITTKSSPLGNRYVATRTSVNVEASDDTQHAVTGVFQGDYVITTSSTAISPGDYVRLSSK